MRVDSRHETSALKLVERTAAELESETFQLAETFGAAADGHTLNCIQGACFIIMDRVLRAAADCGEYETCVGASKETCGS
jgi:hypothetical protein